MENGTGAAETPGGACIFGRCRVSYSRVTQSFAYRYYTRGHGAGRGQMPLPELRVPLEVIRLEAGMACEASSLRSVAAETGMTAMGLRGFIRGERAPQERTIRKLNLWYTRRIATRVPEGEAEARSALVVLGGLYPQKSRVRAQRHILDAVEAGFRDSRMEPPAWLATLRAELQDTPE